jgi:hypothetical protein
MTEFDPERTFGESAATITANDPLWGVQTARAGEQSIDLAAPATSFADA